MFIHNHFFGCDPPNEGCHSIMPHLHRTAPFALLALVLAFLLPGSALAQERVSFQISPTIVEDSIDPGTDHSYVITVKNLGDQDATLYPIARNITGVDSDSQPIYSLDAADQQYELASWVTYQESEVHVPVGGSAQLHFSIKFPKDAHPGSHMAGVFLTDRSAAEIKNGSSIGFEIGSILSFRVAGEIIEKTEIREFYASKSVYGSPEVSFTLRVENEGNVLSKPYGLIDITNMFGKKVVSIPVNESAAGVYPKAIREFNASWSSDRLEFGRYEAVVALIVDDMNGAQTISRVVQFWVLPMNVLTPILIGFLVLVLIVYILLRIYVRRQLAGVRSARASAPATRGISRLAVVVIALLVAIIIGLFLLFFYFG